MASEPRQRRSAPKAKKEAQKTDTGPAAGWQGIDQVTDWIAHVWRLITALAAIAVVVIAWMQWRALRDLDRALHDTQRPWVAASVEPVELVFDDKGGGITLNLTLKNGGSEPAIDVLSAPVLLLDPKRSYLDACRRYGTAGGFGPTLFKDDAVSKTSTIWLSRSDFGKEFPTLVAVCVRYRYPHSPRTGESGYLFSIVRHNPPGPDLYFVEPKNGAFTPPELALRPAGSYHN